MNPLISVVVPVYNGQDYLKKCIDSIVNQTYPNLEILIVNDGSTDGTRDLCDQLLSEYNERIDDDSRIIHVINIGDEGVSAARNRGIDHATGEFICFVDADDRIKPDMIQVLYDNMISSGSDVSGCQFIKWTTEEEWADKVRDNSSRKDKYIIYDGIEFGNQIINGNSRCWSKLYSSKVLRNRGVRFTEGLTIGEDMVFLAELMKTGVKFCESSYRGYGYYQNNAGAMNKSFSPRAMDQILCWEKARNILGASAKIDSIILISVLLTVGRIAVLDKGGREKYCDEIKSAHNTLKKYYSREALGLLDRGYKIKVAIFKAFPGFYVRIYNVWKK